MTHMDWAHYHRLSGNDFFLVTEAILNTEREIVARGGEKLTDALYFTRRFEYPWVFTQIPADIGVVLDAGGGPASFQYYLSQCFPFVHNIDFNEKWIKKVNATKRITKMFNNLTIERGDLSNLEKVSDNLFDVTACISVIEHNKDKVFEIMDELLRVTKKTVFITTDIGENDDEFLSMKKLYELEERYKFMIPYVPPDVMRGITPRDTKFKIACIRLDKE